MYYYRLLKVTTSLQVTEYSSKLLASEKRCSGLRDEMDSIRDAVRSREQDIEQLKIQHDLGKQNLGFIGQKMAEI